MYFQEGGSSVPKSGFHRDHQNQFILTETYIFFLQFFIICSLVAEMAVPSIQTHQSYRASKEII